jgi:glycosyltransferase involved in cell wall biosynthesis
MPVSPEQEGTTRDAVRKALETPARDLVFVQVGRLEALKGHRTAIAALSQLIDVPGWTYWIVGGPQRASDERLLRSLQHAVREAGIEERVRFAGERRDVPDLLRAADIYVQPNDGPEAFGLSLVEALAAGLPVVTSRIGGACEIVDDTCGVLVPPGDAKTLASELRRLALVDELREAKGAAARRRPDVLCNVPRQLARIHDILAGVVSRRMALVS